MCSPVGWRCSIDHIFTVSGMPKFDGVGVEMEWLGRGDHAPIHVLMAAVGVVPNDGEALVLEMESYLIGAAADGMGKE